MQAIVKREIKCSIFFVLVDSSLKPIRFKRFKNAFNGAKAIRIISTSIIGIISNNIPNIIIRVIRRRNNNISFKEFSSKKYIIKNFRTFRNRFDISKMLSNKKTFRIIIRKSKKRLRTKAIKATEDFECEKEYQQKENIYQQEK